MTWLRNSLIGAIFIVAFLLLVRWNDFQERKLDAQAPQQFAINQQKDDLPEAPESKAQNDDFPEVSADSSKPAIQEKSQTTSDQLIHVKTDTFDIYIDPVGGDLEQVALRKYKAKLNDPNSAFLLLTHSSKHTYIAQSGLIGKNGTHTREHGRTHFNVEKNNFDMQDNQDELNVDLTATQNNGAKITKRYTFKRDSYLIGIKYLVDNQSSENWEARIYGRIKRDDYRPPSDVGIGIKPFVGAAITTPETNYHKMSLEDISEKPFSVEKQGGWVAMVQHYFMSAWIPDPEQHNSYKLHESKSSRNYLLEYTGENVAIPAGQQGVIQTSYYAGPKIIKSLEKIAPHLDLTIDFSWLWFISKPLFMLLDFIHSIIGNWGVSIILLTCVVKAIFFYPSAMSYRSMAKMRKLMPQMQEIKERYGNDRQKQGMETMKLYKKEGVNPLGGCLPMLIQMPVFLALYWALMESVELRHSPFFFWIHDLSVKDPYFILPLIMGATMFLQQRLSPAPQDPMQAKVMKLMPIFFTALFLMFPAGLVIYWITNNCLSITQQYYITKKVENES